MAHKKGVGSTDNGRDSNSKRLGVKLFGGQYAKAGNIIIRQRGTKYHPGQNVYLGKDHTVHARIEGTVYFTKKQGNRTVVNIRPLGEVAETVATVAPKKAAPKKAAPKKAAPAPAAAAPAAAAPKASGKPDDLKKVEGIGPKIAEHLSAAGILTFSDLAGASVESIKEILTAAGPRYAIHNPTTWPMQAGLAAEGKWDELKKWQDESDGGKPIASSEEE
jgi:large subunit ribosomal protein L27